jgi:hypothetical protein
VTLVVSMLAALVALKPGVIAGHVPVEWLILGFPVASTCLAFLNFKAERAITNLRRFVSSLERLELDSHGLPSYNTDPQWAAGANKARRFHDSRPPCWWPAATASAWPPASASIRNASAKTTCCSARPF